MLLSGWQVSLAECQEMKKALEGGALDVLAPATATQKDVIEFRERVLRWIDELNQRTGKWSLVFTWPKLTL